MAAVEQRRPLLGTFVTVRVEGLTRSQAEQALDAAFDAVAAVHSLMSFHEAGSDLSRLNRDAHRKAVTVDRETIAVLQLAQVVAAQSDGAFDITAAGVLVCQGALPPVSGAPAVDPAASWKDVLVDIEDGSVRFGRPLLIDLGGIAKGYAVDRAVAVLRRHGATGGMVEAGGDLRVFGPPAWVALDAGDGDDGLAPVLELSDGAAASSGQRGARRGALHLDGRDGAVIGGRFACVVAQDCVIADALTKVVLALGDAAEPVLRHFQAHAHVTGPAVQWRSLALSAAQPALDAASRG